MDNYLYAIYEANAFWIDTNIELFGEHFDVTTKIDIGVTYSFLPLKSLGYYTDSYLSAFKEDLYNSSNVELRYLHRASDFSKTASSRDINNKSLVFRCDVNSCMCNNILLPMRHLSLSCDSVGRPLLGIDVLSQMDFHVGISRITNKCTFIGCPFEKLSNDYLRVLEDHFGYTADYRLLASLNYR